MQTHPLYNRFCKAIALIICTISSITAKAQSPIVKAEYFVDVDPGFGKAVNIPLTPGHNIINAAFPVNTSSLNDGFHTLFLRSKDAANNWSITNGRSFYKTTTNVLPNLVKAEYFVDNDPGFGKAVNIPVTSSANINDLVINVNLSKLNEGIHHLYIRSKNANDHWSITNKASFYKTNNGTPANIISAEYFIDKDPGFGKAKKIIIASMANVSDKVFSVDLTGVSVGNHTLFIRSFDGKGNWSITNRDTFSLPTPTELTITLDTISGEVCAGSGIKVPFSVNAPFGSTNIFKAQLSDGNGSFNSPVNIGSLTGANSDTIAATIPANVFAASGYKIRVIASSPSDTSNVSVNSITIGRVPEKALIISGTSNTCSGVQTYNASAGNAGTIYTWALSSGGSVNADSATAIITWTAAGTHSIKNL